MEYYQPLQYIVSAEEDERLLKTILQSKLGISRKLLSRLKQTEKGITVNGERRYVSSRVQAGDVIEVRMEQEVSTDILPQNLPITILFEDEHLLVVNKQAGMIVHPTHGHYIHTLANAVVYYWKEASQNHRFRPVHRLDKDTSGVLVVAKNPLAHQAVSEQLKLHTVEKEYVAFVHGSIATNKGTIDAAIDRDKENPHVRVVDEEGYAAVTHFQVLERFAYATKVKLHLETGRTHQIRVHMKHLGHPLIGDTMYFPDYMDEKMNQRQDWIPRQALHAVRFSCSHPIYKEWVTFLAEQPEDMKRLEEQLRKE